MGQFVNLVSIVICMYDLKYVHFMIDKIHCFQFITRAATSSVHIYTRIQVTEKVDAWFFAE